MCAFIKNTSAIDTNVDYGNREIPLQVIEFEQLYDERCGGYRNHPSNKDFVNYASVEVEVGRFYYSFVNLVGANYILETGTNIGYSTAMLAAALKRCSPEGKVYTIDIAAQEHLFRNSSLDNIEVIVGNSLEYVNDMNLIFDILVLDSDHSYFTIMNELIKYERSLRVGGYILMHDSLYFDGVGIAVEQLMNNRRFEAVTLESPRTHGRATRSPGVSVIKKISDDERYPLVYRKKFSHIEINAFEGENDCSESYINKIRARSRDLLGTPAVNTLIDSEGKNSNKRIDSICALQRALYDVEIAFAPPQKQIALTLARMTHETNLHAYLALLKILAQKFLVIVCVKDTPGLAIDETVAETFMDIGFKQNLQAKHWHSYVAVMDSGQLIHETLGEEEEASFYKADIDGLRLELSSMTFRKGNSAKIQINNVDYAVNSRGLNIFIFDKMTSTPLDSVCFDTHIPEFTCIRKQQNYMPVIQSLMTQAKVN